jgi:dihydroxy-acid dehydratase
MSGTSYGTCVLHVAPEAAVGGPLALVRDGDQIELDVPERRLDLVVAGQELDRRRATAAATQRVDSLSGYGELFVRHVTQANLGCDFDFLHRRERIGEPVIH